MKFVCMKCETYMNFEKVEKPAEGSLGVFFGCPSCGARFTMVTNPGETQMVSSLGVQLGGRTVAQQPFEMTRGGLRGEGAAPAEGEKKTGGCPFSAVVAQMGLGSSGEKAHSASEFEWTPDALERLEKTPSFVRPMVKGGIEAYARKQGFKKITLQVMDDSKNAPSGIAWSPAAEKRLENIPDFIRPMARKEVERIAQETGATLVTESMMDQAKTKFMNFM